MRVGTTGLWLKFYLPFPLLALWILFYIAVFVKYVHFSILNGYTGVFEGELYKYLLIVTILAISAKISTKASYGRPQISAHLHAS